MFLVSETPFFPDMILEVVTFKICLPLESQNMESMKISYVRYQILYVVNSYMLITLHQQEIHASERSFKTDLFPLNG